MISLRKHREIACLLAGILAFAAACKKSSSFRGAQSASAPGRPAGSPAQIQQGRELTSEEVSRCGFTPVFANKAFAGYRPTSSLAQTPQNYIFPSAATINELKVSLMLARTCSDVITNHAERVEPPCNDGLGLINLHAKDAAFLGAVGARVNGRPDQCVQFMIGHLTAPVTFPKYASLLDATISRNKKMNAEFRAYWKSHSSGQAAE